MTTSDKKVPSPFDLSGRPSIFSDAIETIETFIKQYN